jgi:hypothetical protein
MLSVTQTTECWMVGWLVSNELKGSGRKLRWPNQGTMLESAWSNWENPYKACQESWYPGQDLNRAPTEYKHYCLSQFSYFKITNHKSNDKIRRCVMKLTALSKLFTVSRITGSPCCKKPWTHDASAPPFLFLHASATAARHFICLCGSKVHTVSLHSVSPSVCHNGCSSLRGESADVSTCCLIWRM